MGFTNIKQFQEDLDNFIKVKVWKENKRRHIEIIIFMLTHLQDTTPVNEPRPADWSPGGHARNNWRVTMQMKQPKNILGTRMKPGRPTNSEIVRGQLGTYKAGGTIWIFNNVKYLQALEDGNSRDKSKGYMVVRTIIATKNFIRQKGWY